MKLLKIILIGLCTTAVRIAGQLMIPAGEQTVLAPSLFVQSGYMPLAFSLYGLLAYSLIAALFLLIEKRMPGPKMMQGLKYGLSCCAVWTAYLLEPLPHVALPDKFTYPLADGAALIVLGLFCGLLLGKNRENFRVPYFRRKNMAAMAALTICFVLGRLLQYLAFKSYSSFAANSAGTLLWCVFTGAVLSVDILWLERFVKAGSRFKRAAILGLLLFGVDLTMFNFFMPLVFAADIPDLIMRTGVDILAVFIPCLLFHDKKDGTEITA